MSDPISLIALGAAVGGAAGKLSERTWECGERWLRERFGSHAKKVQDRARLNAGHFVQQLAIRVEKLEQQRQLSDRMLDEETHPEFSALLQRSLLNAAQTEDEVKQDLLADLVAARLGSKAETTLALASQLASDAITRSTRHQLRLMALFCFLEEVRPRTPLPPEQYRLWIGVHLRPFEEFEFYESDASHLVAIGCASYDATSSRCLELLLKMKGGPEHIETPVADIVEVEILDIQWRAGLAGVSLTSVGSLVGGLALSQITGRDCGPPSWSKRRNEQASY